MKTTKPYNSEIIKAMAKYNDECAAYASAIKWDWLRRQKVEDIEDKDIKWDCGFCEKYGTCYAWDITKKCPLSKAQKVSCRDEISLYMKALNAYNTKDQQAFAEAANNLYYQIRSIIDDFYKPKKEEVFYHAGQNFTGGFGGEYRLAVVSDHNEMLMVCKDGCGFWGHTVCVKDIRKITKSEFVKICQSDTFTLIEDKKK